MGKHKGSGRKGKRKKVAKPRKLKKVAKQIPLTLKEYLKRYGAPKKGTPRREEYEKSYAFRKRREAVRKGQVKRGVKRLAEKVFVPFVQTLEEGGTSDEIKRAHKRWIKGQKFLRPLVSAEEWRSFLDDWGDALDFDEDFIDALDESPEGSAA